MHPYSLCSVFKQLEKELQTSVLGDELAFAVKILSPQKATERTKGSFFVLILSLREELTHQFHCSISEGKLLYLRIILDALRECLTCENSHLVIRVSETKVEQCLHASDQAKVQAVSFVPLNHKL